MAKTEKTNVMRILEQKKINYKSYEYSDAISGVEVATVLNEDVNQVFKTLVTVGASKVNYVFMIPVHMELDLKKAAKAVGEKSVAMIKSKELLPLTGYIHGGCSPIGMKKKFPTFINKSCENHEKITVSAGIKGCQLLLNTSELISYTEAKLCDLTTDKVE